MNMEKEEEKVNIRERERGWVESGESDIVVIKWIVSKETDN